MQQCRRARSSSRRSTRCLPGGRWLGGTRLALQAERWSDEQPRGGSGAQRAINAAVPYPGSRLVANGMQPLTDSELPQGTDLTHEETVDLSQPWILADGLDHPEGIAVGPDGMLFAGGEAGQIYRIDPANGSWEQIASTGGFILGLCLDSASRIYACDSGRRAILRISPADGVVDVYCDQAGGRPLRMPNWLVFAPDGTLWFSDSGTESREVVNGTLVRVPPGGGEGEVLDTPPLHLPNGLALAPDGTLFVVESFGARVLVVRGGHLEPYVKLPGTVPDGLALDAEGGLLVSCYQPNRIIRVTPSEGPKVILDDWTGESLLTPTNVAFFGEDRSKLAIACLGGWAIRAVQTPWRGQGLHYPVVP
jgi:gluconolactonase